MVGTKRRGDLRITQVRFRVILPTASTAAATTATAPAAAATTATAATAATTTTATATWFGLGFINAQVAPHVILFVQGLDSGQCFVLLGHFDEAEALGVAREFVDDYASRGYGSVFREQVVEVRVVYLVRQVAYINIHVYILQCVMLSFRKRHDDTLCGSVLG
jgi:hypothetical protein